MTSRPTLVHALASTHAVRKGRKRRQKPEELIQRACAALMRSSVPKGPEGPFWTAVNPVPAKSKAVAGISWAMGMQAGVLDFWIMWRGKTIAVEFKEPKKGRLSEAQHERIAELEANGAIVEVCTSMDEFIKILRRHAIPCRANNNRFNGGV